MAVLNILYWVPMFAFIRINAVPPDACFANFRWDDCGKSPVPVMYYWKPGSRCEVGLWRGCLPNPNMFQDEYECVTTCIFTERAMPEDYHSVIDNEIDDQDIIVTTETAGDSTTDVATTTSGTITEGGDGWGTVADEASAATTDSPTTENVSTK